MLTYPYAGNQPPVLHKNGDQVEVPTDMFYAELSGTWDYDGDGYYGDYFGDRETEGADQYCELAVGRIPVYSSNDMTKLDKILSMAMTYEDATNTSYRQKHLIAADILNFAPLDLNGDGDTNDKGELPDPASHTYGDGWGEAVKNLTLQNGNQPFTLYEKAGLAYPDTWCNAPLTKDNLLNEWKIRSINYNFPGYTLSSSDHNI